MKKERLFAIAACIVFVYFFLVGVKYWLTFDIHLLLFMSPFALIGMFGGWQIWQRNSGYACTGVGSTGLIVLLGIEYIPLILRGGIGRFMGVVGLSFSIPLLVVAGLSFFLWKGRKTRPLPPKSI